METRFTQAFGCDAPLQLAPMGLLCTPELVAGVHRSGGMGMLGTAGVPAKVVARVISAIREAVGEAAIGGNVLLPFLDEDVLDVLIEGVDYVDFYLGAPRADLVRRAHDGGCLAGWQVGTVDEARSAAAIGCDLIITRGIEGGGRFEGDRSTWPLLWEVLDAVPDVPVVVAGGIASGRGLAAALACGADGARVGTRLLATHESGAHDEYKQALVEASGSDTMLTDLFVTGWPADAPSSARALSSAVETARRLPDGPIGEVTFGGRSFPIERYAPPPPSRSFSGEISAMALYAGESVGAITEVEPAEEVVRTIVEEAEALLGRGSAASQGAPGSESSRHRAS